MSVPEGAVRHRAVGVAHIAVVVALSGMLGQLRLLQLPLGGSVTLATLPLVALALVAGWRPAALAGAAAGTAHALLGGIVVHPAQYLLDYGLAWVVLALAGPAAAGGLGVRAAVVVAELAHLAVFTVSGALFFAEFAGSLPVVWYSLAYNAGHVVPELVLVAWLVPTAVRAWQRAMPPQASLS